MRKGKTSAQRRVCQSSPSFASRPLDWFIVVSFIVMGVIAVFVDLVQALGGSSSTITPGAPRGVGDWKREFGDWHWPPAFLLEWFHWWTVEVDPLLMANPLWYRLMSVVSPLLYLPFYATAVYAFIKGRNWIRIPALLWGACLLYSMIIIMAEELWGPYKSPQPLLMLSAYGPYVVLPIIVIIRVANRHPFGKFKRQGNKKIN